MTSRRLRVAATKLRAGSWQLPDDTARYVTRVHRCRAGQLLCLFDPAVGQEAEATLVSERPAVVNVEEVRPATPTALPVEIWQAVGKGDKPEQVVRDATVLGAARVVLVATGRTVAKSHGGQRAGRLERVAIEAARQCGRGEIPLIDGPLPLSELLDEGLSGAQMGLACVWTPEARPLLEYLRGTEFKRGVESQRLVLLIGPEGGLSDSEVCEVLGAGFLPVSLGPLVLRTETAATVALGAIRLVADLQTNK